MVNKYKKRCLALLIIREIQIKSTMRCYLISVRMTSIPQVQKIASVGEAVEKLKSLYTIGRNVEYCNYCGKSIEIPQKYI